MRSRMKAGSVAASVAIAGLVATVVGGTWWVAMAIEDGKPLDAVFRLGLVGLCGGYYVMLLEAVTLTTRRRSY